MPKTPFFAFWQITWVFGIGTHIPCESSRPGDSESVVLFGRATFLTGVIAAQSRNMSAKLKASRKLGGVKKKVTATTFGFRLWNWITPSEIYISRAWLNFRSEIQKLWLWLFFLTPPNFGDAFNFAGMFRLWEAITPVRKVARSKSTTFSESSGGELSHWSYPGKKFLPHENVEEKGF